MKKKPGKAARLLHEAKECQDPEERERLGKEARSYIMSRIRGRDTSPELLVRSWVKEAGTKVPTGASPYWLLKLERNKERDRWNYRRLEEMGIRVLVVWECEIRTKALKERTRETFLGTLRELDALAEGKRNEVI